MSDKSRDLYRGLLIPDGDLSRIWAAESTVDEAGNRAGIPATSSKTETVLEASGHQTDTGDGETLEVLTSRGGYGGPGGAGFVWRQTAGAVQQYRGCDVPGVPSTWENVDYNSSSTFNLNPDLVNITRTDGSDYMRVVYEFSSGGNARVATRKRTGDVWGAETIIHTEPSAGSLLLNPSVLTLPTGRLLVFFLVYDTEVVGSYPLIQLQMKYSDDEGATWVIGSRYALTDPLDTSVYEIERVRCAYKDGQILIVMHAKNQTTALEDVLLQFASDDLGTTFILITEFSGVDEDNAGGYPDIAVLDGVFVVAWIRRGVTFQIPTAQRLGSAYEDLIPTNGVIAVFTGFDSASVFGNNFAQGELSLCSDEDGVLYLLVTKNPRTEGICLIARNLEGAALPGGPGSGSGWLGVGKGGSTSPNFGRWWGADYEGAGFSAVQPIGYTAEQNRGRLVVVHRYMNRGTQDPIGENSLCFFYLGGFSTVTFPGLELFRTDTERAGLPISWVPFGMPIAAEHGCWIRNNFGFAPLAEGIFSPGRLHLQMPPGGRVHYQITPAEGPGNNQVLFRDGFIGRFTYEVAGAPSLQMLWSRVWSSAAGNTYGQLNINITDTAVTVEDGAVGGVLATIPNAVGQKRQIFWAVRGIEVLDNPTGAECAVWWRDWNVNEDRQWEPLYQGPLGITNGGSSSFVHWGDREIPTSSDQFWYECHVSCGSQMGGTSGPFVGRQLAQGQANPDDLFPRNYSASPLYVDSDTRIAAIDGPTFEADQWTITARHLQGTENVFASVSPSPAKTWRSKTATPGDIIAFQRNPDGDDAWSANDFYAIHFENVNFKRAQLQVLTGGVWVNVVNISFYKQFEFSRNGHSIRPAGDDSNSFYAYYNEFKGLKFEFNPDPLFGNPQIATILRNSEGIAYEGTASKPTTLFLDPDTFNSATAPTSGTAHIWFKNMTVLLPGPVSSTPFEGIRLQLCQSGTLPPEGFFSAGNIIPGPVCVFGWNYSRERNITKTPNVELTTLRDGTRHAYKAGDERRRVRFSWAEGVDVTQLREEWGLPLDPDYVKASAAGGPVALRQDGPLLMWGLLDRIDGPGLPVVYIPKIDFSNAGSPNFDPRQYARGAIYGRTVTPITLETVVGAEEKTEVYRVNTVTIEEEV